MQPAIGVCALILVHAVSADTGGHHHHTPHHQPQQQAHHVAAQSYSSSDKCSPHYNVGHLKSSIADIDYQLHHTLASLPAAIQKARSAVQSGTVDTNRDVLIVGIACFIGALSGSLGILYGKNPLELTNADQISLLAMNSWGYGYWGPYLLELSETDPGCGVEDFNKVVYEYSYVTNLKEVYGTDPSAYAITNSDDRPELRKYYLGEFGRKLKLALHCITSQGSSVAEAGSVVNLIDKYVNLGYTRLDLTNQLI